MVNRTSHLMHLGFPGWGGSAELASDRCLRGRPLVGVIGIPRGADQNGQSAQSIRATHGVPSALVFSTAI